MKSLIKYLIGAFCLIVVYCCEEYYEYLEEDTLFVFMQNDTLVYKGISKKDTFVVSYVNKKMIFFEISLFILILSFILYRIRSFHINKFGILT